MRKCSWAELGATPYPGAGPFSKYLNATETGILLALLRRVAPKVMIEFGCNSGVTAKRLLERLPTLTRYIGVDVPADYVPTLSCQFSEVPRDPGYFAASDPRFLFLESPSGYLRTGHLEPCDAVFIDGDHSEVAVLHESWLSRALLRPGGIIVWHDYGNPAVEVTYALDRLSCEGWPIASVEQSWLAFMRV